MPCLKAMLGSWKTLVVSSIPVVLGREKTLGNIFAGEAFVVAMESAGFAGIGFCIAADRFNGDPIVETAFVKGAIRFYPIPTAAKGIIGRHIFLREKDGAIFIGEDDRGDVIDEITAKNIDEIVYPRVINDKNIRNVHMHLNAGIDQISLVIPELCMD